MLEKVKMSSVEQKMKMVFSHCNVPLFLRIDDEGMTCELFLNKAVKNNDKLNNSYKEVN